MSFNITVNEVAISFPLQIVFNTNMAEKDFVVRISYYFISQMQVNVFNYWNARPNINVVFIFLHVFLSYIFTSNIVSYCFCVTILWRYFICYSILLR